MSFDFDFDAINDFIELSILSDDDAKCPNCSAALSPSASGTINCPACGAKIRIS